MKKITFIFYSSCHIKQSESSEGVRGEQHLLNLDEKERTAHSFCGKLKTGWDGNKKREIIIIIMMV